ncbi:MAG: hypothetical protein IIX53_01975 [Phascolarctobacterium sp.]|nr:hypothetical protein [Phascolarctobacterium sp.]MBQ5672651.1 hypothetical protein [Phascolarctobacterium sp.]
MTSSLYKANRMQGGYGGNSIGYNRNGRGYENRRGEDYDTFRQAIQNADNEFFERMQEEARQRGIREEDIRQGMQMIQGMRQGGNGGRSRNFRMEKGGKYYG